MKRPDYRPYPVDVHQFAKKKLYDEDKLYFIQKGQLHLDLHGHSIPEALKRTRAFLQDCIGVLQDKPLPSWWQRIEVAKENYVSAKVLCSQVNIITGTGEKRDKPGVLIHEIPQYLKESGLHFEKREGRGCYIVFLDSSSFLR